MAQARIVGSLSVLAFLSTACDPPVERRDANVRVDSGSDAPAAPDAVALADAAGADAGVPEDSGVLDASLLDALANEDGGADPGLDAAAPWDTGARDAAGSDAGRDAGTAVLDAGRDAGRDAGTAVLDAGRDAGRDAGTDASCSPSIPSTAVPSLAAIPTARSRELIGTGATAFSAAARLGSSVACSNDYTRTDFCHNAENPPAPSITRRVGITRGHDTTDRVVPYHPAGQREEPSLGRSGDMSVLPFDRTSNDGRIGYDGRWMTWPVLYVNRPEAYGPDFRLQTTRAITGGTAAELHMLAWFDPTNTSYTVSSSTAGGAQVNNLLGSINALHSTLCDTSSPAEANAPRNPIPCDARYGDFAYDGAAPTATELQRRSGVCYRLTALIGGEVSSHWELRSAPFTLFLPNAYRADTATDGYTAWVYPGDPDGVFSRPDADGTVHLPDFADFDLGRLFPWNRVNATMNVMAIGTTPTVDMGHAMPVPANCYTRSGSTWTRNPSAPRWCQFPFGQTRAANMTFDNNHNAIAERRSTHPSATLVNWNGTSDGGGHYMFELMTTGDGRVLFMNENNALYYSVNERGACRADGFTAMLPVSLMPVDPMLLPSATHPGYGMARSANGQPFRDPSGRPIPLGSLHHFAYPWVDRSGSNLFFSMVNEQRDAYYPAGIQRLPVDSRIAPGTITPEPAQEAEQAHRLDGLNTRAAHQIGFVGAWSQGRFIVADNGLNASDLGGLAAWGRSSTTGGVLNYEIGYDLALYRDSTLRFIPKGASTINSFENRFGMFDALRPRLPFDVVWAVTGNNQQTSELIFDEFMDTRAWVVAPMNASLRFYDDTGMRSSRGAALVAVEDGFTTGSAGNRWTDDPNYTFNGNASLDGQPSARPILQNAAPRTPVNQLRLRGGARIEPVAMGGVLGRGVYFDGMNDFVDLGYPSENHHDWYFGAWLEPRQASYAGDVRREVFRFADGSFFGLYERNGRYDFVAFAKNPDREQVVGLGNLIVPGRFAHLGVRVTGTSTSRQVEVFVNGTSVRSFTLSGTAMPGLTPMNTCGSSCGTWTWMTFGAGEARTLLGAPSRSFAGWVDELRIYRLRPEDRAAGSGFDETQCNLALGTMVRATALTALRDRFAAQTGVAPTAVCEQLRLESQDEPADLTSQRGRSVCVEHVHRALGADCLRTSLLDLPTMRAEAPRPSDTANAFCLSCHTSSSPIPGLQLGALTLGTVPRFRDPRRQPLNPPAVIGLPRYSCPGWPLDGTFYGAFPRAGRGARADGSWTVDHVIDEAVLGGNGYFPPSP